MSGLGFELGVNGQQLVDAVGAGVAGKHGLQALLAQRNWRRMVPPSLATRKSRPGVNSPSASFHGAETSGMPQASASNTRMVGMPGSAWT